MAELGIDLSHEVPTKLSFDDVDAAGVVITWAVATRARSSPASATSTGSSTTPPALAPERVRPIRDDIDRRVRELLTELVRAPTM
jgi:arsenate reductase (thioredoxin)